MQFAPMLGDPHTDVQRQASIPQRQWIRGHDPAKAFRQLQALAQGGVGQNQGKLIPPCRQQVSELLAFTRSSSATW